MSNQGGSQVNVHGVRNGRVGLRYPVGGGLNDGFQGLPGACLGRAQPEFSLLKASPMRLKLGE